jgi:hypothetical protein
LRLASVAVGVRRVLKPICCRVCARSRRLTSIRVSAARLPEFVRGGFAAVDEGFVVDDRGVESCDEVEEIVSPSMRSVKKSGPSVARARSSSRSVCLASSS